MACGSVLLAGSLTFSALAPAARSATPGEAATRPAAPREAVARAADQAVGEQRAAASGGPAVPAEGSHVRNVVASKKEVEYLTAEWKGARYPDGRPKVSDGLLKRMRIMSVEQAWGALRERGYHNQFAGEWKTIHADRTVIGRALTAQYMPSSPDLEKRLTGDGHKAGHEGQMNTWPIALLRDGDVYVADGFGKVQDGTLIGGNLGEEIHSRTHTGVVFDGSLRDLEELDDIKGFNAFVRDWHPSYIQQMMLTGVNTHIRIGEAVVLPGDVVLAKREGIVFIPAHLVEDIVEEAEVTLLRDLFVKQRLREGTYTSGQVDKGWDEVDQAIKDDFRGWLQENKNDLPVPAERVQEIIDAAG
ncbi:RraA family protein [Streptomyces sp. NPDC006134]|uniref:RraA family protein n=1 Tax=Streptomyces sp. NPDC006134 TaxID=3154467 RepID=UPI0033D26437